MCELYALSFFLFKLRHLITVWASAALTITDEVKNLNSCSYWGRDLHELNLNKNYLELKKKKSSGRPSGNKLESLEKKPSPTTSPALLLFSWGFWDYFNGTSDLSCLSSTL